MSLVGDAGLLSDAERARYHRHAMVMGFDSQIKLRDARTLIIGAGNLAGEVAKNLVLMGTNVTLFDPFVVTKEELQGNPFINREFLGKNRAVALRQKLLQFNSLVSVNVLQVPDLISLPEDFFSSFDVVAHLSKEFGLEHRKTIASHCRNLGVKLLTGSCYGEIAIAHADLLRHKFTVSKSQTATNQETEVGEIQYPSMDQVFNWNWSDSLNSSMSLRQHFVLIQILEAFKAANKTFPNEETSVESIDNVVSAVTKGKYSTLDSLGLDRELVSKTLRKSNIELSAMASILGGIVGQEIAKTITQKDRTIENTVIVDGTTQDVTASVMKLPQEKKQVQIEAIDLDLEDFE